MSDSVISISRPEGEAADLIAPTTTDQKLDDLIVDDSVKGALKRGIEEQSHLSEIMSQGLRPQRTFLFTGPPGCGKTMAASVIANALHLPLFTVRLDAIITRYLGESSQKLRAVFTAIEQSRAVYLFDEFDSLGLERGSAQDVAEMRRVLNSFLVFVESFGGNSLVVAATNHAESLDFALFRRFDALIEFEMPTAEQCLLALQSRLKGVQTPKSVDLEEVADAAHGLSFADLARVVDDSLKWVIIGHSKTLSTSLLLEAVNRRKDFLSKNRRV
ncbi:MAG: ATP-binding protein [Verrucomicrobiales bacterium]